MKIIAAIPARYAATRFPGKLMQLLHDKPVIVHTWENAMATGIFDDVIVATDSEIIFHEINQRGGTARMSQRSHESGSDRIAEAVEKIDADVVVNIQGDEPMLQKAPLQKLADVFRNDEAENIAVASMMQIIDDPEEVSNPNMVKVVVDKNGDALYFSRSPIPFPRDAQTGIPYFRHIGVYAYRKKTLLAFTKLSPTPLEMTEKLEQLRLLENGFTMRMVQVDFSGIGIDTPEDLEKARRMHPNAG